MTAVKKPRPRKARTVVRWVNYYAHNKDPFDQFGFIYNSKHEARKERSEGGKTLRLAISLPLRGDKKK